MQFFQELGQLYSLPYDSEIVDINLKEHWINAVLNNYCIIDQSNNWSQVSFFETYYIKPETSGGLNSTCFNRFDSQFVYLLIGCNLMLCNTLAQ